MTLLLDLLDFSFCETQLSQIGICQMRKIRLDDAIGARLLRLHETRAKSFHRTGKTRFYWLGRV